MSSVASSRGTRGKRNSKAESSQPLQQPVNVVTPKRKGTSSKTADEPKKKRAVNNKYFFFNMGDDMQDAFFMDVDQAAQHRRDFEGLIVQEKGFSRKKDFLIFKKQHENPVLNPKTAPVASPSNGNESALADQIVSLMNNDNNSDRIEACWKVTSSSDKCVVILRFKSQCGTDAWVWKSDMKCVLFNKWADAMEIKDQLLFEFFSNMKSGKASDPDNSDKNTPLVTVYNPPSDPKKSIQIHVERAYSFITIPHDSLSSQKEETEWINTNVLKLLRGLRDTLNSPLFKTTMERLGQGRRQNYINKLYNPSLKSNLPKFLNGCVVKCIPCNYLTDHVIQVVSNDIMTRMWQHRLEGPKYESPVNEGENSDEDDPEDELHDIDNNDLPDEEAEGEGDGNNDQLERHEEDDNEEDE